MLGIMFANGPRMRGFMEPETSYHELHGHFFRDSLGAGLGRGYRSITVVTTCTIQIPNCLAV